MRRRRDANMTLPTEVATAGGLAYSLWLPDGGSTARGGAASAGAALAGTARGGTVILHGAGSVKESHHDFARVLVAAGFGAIVFDQRGHGESTGPMDDSVVDDIAAMAALLRERLGDPQAPLALRGSSMGGYFAIVAAATVGARAVVSICPASGEGLRRGLAAGTLPFDADPAALDGFWASHDIAAAVASAAGTAAAPARRGRRGRPGGALTGTRHAPAPSVQSPDRRARRAPPLDPAR